MSFDNFLRSINRRTFLKIVSIAGISGLIYPRKLIASLIPGGLSRVVIVEDSSATNGLSINPMTVWAMMDSAARALSEQYDVGEAWKTLLPGIGLSNKIAIKVNCINSSLSTHPIVTNAVVYGLKKMSFGGNLFPENNIIIYDRTTPELIAAGYTINTSGTGVRCFGTDSWYSSETYSVVGTSQRISRVITEEADYLINLSVLKNHSFSGVTLCLKNHYGTCNRPDLMHSYHCDPYVPMLNTLSPIRDKHCINICDALFGIYSGGPSGPPQFAANKIIMSRDIVTLDYWGRQILADNGCTTIGTAHHIDTAAQDPYSLGTNDPSQMFVMNINDPSTGVGTSNSSAVSEGVVLQQNHPNPFNGNTQIRFRVSKSEEVKLTIYDAAGRRVRRLASRTFSPGWHMMSWDGHNDMGKQVASGIYFCRLRTKEFKKAIIIQMVK